MASTPSFGRVASSQFIRLPRESSSVSSTSGQAIFTGTPGKPAPQPTACEVVDDNVAVEFVCEEPEPTEPPKTAAKAAAKNQDEKDANWLAMCDELRERNPEIFDKYMTAHNVPDIAEIKGSKDRQKLYTELKSTIDFAEKEANNG